MPFVNSVTSVGTTPVVIATPSAVPENAGVLVQNLGSVVVCIGGSTVTANTAATGGLQVAANSIVNVPTTRAASEQLYAVVASSTANVATLFPG